MNAVQFFDENRVVADEIEIILHESLLFKPVELKERAMALKNHHQKKVTAASSLFFGERLE